MKKYRIRKLTPTECFRLMDVDDDKIKLIQDAKISKSQQYKMAGNSIVVSPMFYLFKSLFVDQTPKKVETEYADLFAGML